MMGMFLVCDFLRSVNQAPSFDVCLILRPRAALSKTGLGSKRLREATRETCNSLGTALLGAVSQLKKQQKEHPVGRLAQLARLAC